MGKLNWNRPCFKAGFSRSIPEVHDPDLRHLRRRARKLRNQNSGVQHKVMYHSFRMIAVRIATQYAASNSYLASIRDYAVHNKISDKQLAAVARIAVLNGYKWGTAPLPDELVKLSGVQESSIPARDYDLDPGDRTFTLRTYGHQNIGK